VQGAGLGRSFARPRRVIAAAVAGSGVSRFSFHARRPASASRHVISSRHRFIFVHVPKTGGNSLQTLLEPHSDDRRRTVAHQDGVDRFDVTGPVTRRKHMTLAEYADVLGDDLGGMRVAVVCRHPLDRALSHYFSPHRWFVESAGAWDRRAPVWDFDRFAQVVDETHSAIEFLKVGGRIRRPDFLIRFECLQDDFDRFVTTADIPLTDTRLPRRNAADAPAALQQAARKDARVMEIVARAFRDDFDFFGYDASPSAVGA
jgi:hypothetical protein